MNHQIPRLDGKTILGTYSKLVSLKLTTNRNKQIDDDHIGYSSSTNTKNMLPQSQICRYGQCPDFTQQQKT